MICVYLMENSGDLGCVCVCVFVYGCGCGYACVSMFISVHACVFLCVCVCVCVLLCVCVCVDQNHFIIGLCRIESIIYFHTHKYTYECMFTHTNVYSPIHAQ